MSCTEMSVLSRGDVDDRVLPEAIVPLLDQLAAAQDVRPLLHKRFNMPRWLASHGLIPAKKVQSARECLFIMPKLLKNFKPCPDKLSKACQRG